MEECTRLNDVTTFINETHAEFYEFRVETALIK